MAIKPDASEIFAHMNELALCLGLNPDRQWWPRYLFRSDHVENAANILNSGLLLSRDAAEQQQVIVKDSGSPGHLAQLTPAQRKYVRLYFRPRTPTQHANEGVRPASQIEFSAHMPVPVYLLFSVRLLMEEDVLFTHGRLESLTRVGRTAHFLRGINFYDVYHDNPVGPPGADRRSEILNARHSEVLKKNSLSLDHVEYIVCRSEPERDTLLSLLTDRARSNWRTRTVVGTKEGGRGLFLRRGTYVQNATLSSTGACFVFFSECEKRFLGPFQLQIELASASQPSWVLAEQQDFSISSTPMKFRWTNPKTSYTVRVKLNGDLVYCGKFPDR